MKTKLIKHAALLLLLSALNPQLSTFAQGTAFTYQGRLNNSGSPATGLYDFRFRLDADPAGNTILATVLTNGVPVSNGLFTTTIDFGAGFFNGSNYWLEVDVTTNIPSGYTQLNPFQPFTPAPYAVFATTAGNVSGAIALAQLPAAVLTNNESGVSVSGTFSGDGGGLTNLNVSAAQLTSIGNTNSGAVNNFFVGLSGNSTTTGTDNTANGGRAFTSDTSGSFNTANGSSAMQDNTSGLGNTANGYSSLLANSGGSFNTADGAVALYRLVGGSNNIALGYLAGSSFNGNESSNIDIGNYGNIGENNTIRIGTPGTQTATFIAGTINGDGGGLTNLNASAAQLTSIGNTNLGAFNNFFVGPSGNSTMNGPDNTAIGSQAFVSNTSGSDNAADGYQALQNNTRGDHNTADGYQALLSNTVGIQNTAGGALALSSNTNGGNNTAYGVVALSSNTSGNNNTAVGSFALFSNTNGGDNTANGTGALGNMLGGTNNIALGHQAGSAFTGIESSNIDIGNPGTVGDNNTIRIGTPGIQTSTFIAGTINGDGGGLTNLNASLLNSVGNNPGLGSAGNFFVGPSGNSTMSGINNTANGDQAFTGDTTGSDNLADGYQALSSNTVGSFNTATGFRALYKSTTGSGNTANGFAALFNNIGGMNNTANGYETLFGLHGGSNNIALGYNAGSAFSGNESSNIDIGNNGNAGENNTIRIGTPGTQANTYIAGSVNVGLSSGANLRLNDQPVYFRGGGDTNHGLAFCGAGVTNFPLPILPDGPVLWGFTGGVLGVLNGTPHAMVSWTGTGVGISNAAPGHLFVVGSSGSPAFCDGTTWQNGSDRNAKENFAAISPRAVLEKVSALPITEWKYKAEADGTEHLGPMAQDFHAAFGLNGADDRHIATVDEEGVALAAIQGLNQKVDEKDARIQEQAREIAGLKQSVAELKQLVQSLAQQK
jgi:hypothetical protein